MKFIPWILVLIGLSIFAYTTYDMFVPLRYIPFKEFIEEYWANYTFGTLFLLFGIIFNEKFIN